MTFRLTVVAAVLGCAIATATAHAQVRSTTIEHQRGSGGTGYDSASFEANYRLQSCGGYLVITTTFVAGSWEYSDTYWVDGKSYPAPDGLTPIVSYQGHFNGQVRKRGGGQVGSFRSIAGQGRHDCLGDLHRVADLSRFVDPKDKDAVASFLDSLEVIPDTNWIFRNIDIENEIRHQLEREAREAKKKAEDDKRKADEDARKADEDARKAREAAEAKAKEDAAANETTDDETSADETSADETTEERVARRADEEAARRADEEARQAAEEAARKAKNDELSANTKWTEADERDTSGEYWPKSRCAWMDDRGFLRLPTGRHRCDPAYIEEVRKAIWEQLEQERLRLEQEERERKARETLQLLSGGTAEGAAIVGGAAALAPVVDMAGEAMRRTNEKWPKTFDLEAAMKVLISGDNGYALSLRAPGLFYFRGAFESYDNGKWERVRAYNMGIGVQLPLTRAFTVRVIELGFTLAGIQHVVDETEYSGGFSMRTGGLFRVGGPLALTANIGLDTTGDALLFTDVGVALRFDLDGNRRYLIR